jgi:excinuclease ABC subunit A
MLVVQGAREHNLAGVDVELSPSSWVALCGPSGSGKSSLAFDTLFAEGQRRYLHALGLGDRAERPPPRVDRISGVPPTLGLAQRVRAPGASTRFAELAEVAPALRLLFGRSGVQHCPRCDRPVVPTSHDAIVDALLQLPVGARLLLEAPVPPGPQVLEEVQRAGFSRIRRGGVVTRLEGLTLRDDEAVRVVVDRIKVAPDRRDRLADSVRLASQAGRGVVVAVVGDEEQSWVDRPYCAHDQLELPLLEPRLLSRRSHTGACAACGGSGCEVCGGTGLSEAARHVRWRGHRWEELLQLGPEGLRQALPSTGQPAELGALEELSRRLQGLEELGLGAVPLQRKAEALSAGEVQRSRLSTVVSSALSGVLYVLDEPAAGLEERWLPAVAEQLRRLRDGGAMVVTVTHRSGLLAHADRVLEFGPGAGAEGGRLVFDGAPAELKEAPTATGRWLSGQLPLPPSRGRTAASCGSHGGVELPLGVLGAVLGGSGSGKSRHLAALAEAGRALESVESVVMADRPAGRSRRSMPATYVGLWDVLRDLLAQTQEARVRGFDASTFSVNVKGGRCEACRGAGEVVIELDALPDVTVPCDVCGGARFARDVLEVRWRGLSAAELLQSDASTLRPVLSGHPKLDAGLGALVRSGLGYVPLGMPTDGLSGGEARRLALARELTRRPAGALYLLDDAEVGLHRVDLLGLVGVLQELVDAGATVWLATHDPELAAVCDVVHELSP